MNYYPAISAQETKTNKQSNKLTVTVSCEKMSCLIRSKKKNKTKQTYKINK